MRCERAPKWACILWLCGEALVFGCGDDSQGGSPEGSGTSSTGGACEQAGYSETGCPCGTGEYGHRSCTEDLVWSECACPDYKWACTEGEPVTCTCPDDHTKHETTCRLGGWVKCPCGGSSGTSGDEV